MKEKQSIIFYERTANRILKSILSHSDNGSVAVIGGTGTGKSHNFESILSMAKKKKVRILNLETTKIIKSNFVLHTFCNELTNLLSPFIKEMKPTLDFDFKSINKILKMKFNENVDKDLFRKQLVEYLMMLDFLMKEFNVKVILAYDDLDTFEKVDLMKIFQLARYVKNYISSISLLLFIDKDKLLDVLEIPRFDELKAEYFNSVITLENSWEHYELENKMIFHFIKDMKITNKRLVIFLLRKNELTINFMKYRFKNNLQSNLMRQLTSELEFITFVLNYVAETDATLFKLIIHSIMAFHLIKDEPRYVATEYRNEDNKAVFSKVRALIEFFHSRESNYFDKNKYAAIVSNIYFPYDFDWQIYFTSEFDEKRIPEDNLNAYMGLLLIFSNIKFWEMKEKQYWFRVEDDHMPDFMKVMYQILLEQKQLYFIPDVNEKIFYYENISDFILFYAKAFIMNEFK